MQLETTRLILRPWRDEDAEDLYRYAQDPQVGPIAGWPVHTSVEHSLSVIRSALSVPETYAVVLKETGHAVGCISIKLGDQGSFPLSDTEAELGFWIGVPYWGQGLIPEAVECLLTRCFEELHREVIWCGYYDGNEKSKRAQEKCGFTYHHTVNNAPCRLLNEVRTEHLNRLTREAWRARHALSST